MSSRNAANTKVVPRVRRPSIAEQEADILAVYADMLDYDDFDGFFDLARHAGIDMRRGDPIQQILKHYWLGSGKYEVRRAIEDFASWPPIVNRIEELRREQRCKRTGGTPR